MASELTPEFVRANGLPEDHLLPVDTRLTHDNTDEPHTLTLVYDGSTVEVRGVRGGPGGRVLAMPGADGTVLVYLDIWEREVNSAEVPGSVHRALIVSVVVPPKQTG